MRIPIAPLGLTVVWVLAAGRFGLADFATGFLLSWGILALLRSPVELRLKPRSLLNATGFGLVYAREFLRSCLQVGRQTLQPPSRLRPAVVDVPIEARTDAEVTLLANLLSYSPGTLCVGVSEDLKHLSVHVMSLEDEAEIRRHVREDLERWVMELLR